MPPIDPFHLDRGSPSPEPDSPRPCPACGYDRRGTAMGQPCPECGRVEVTSGVAWTGTSCIKCGCPTPGLPVGALCRACAQALPPPGERFESHPSCGQCGYSRQGIASSVPCPECGETPSDRGDATPSGVRRTVLAQGEVSFRISNRLARSWHFRAALLAVFWSVVGVAGSGVVSMIGLPNSQYYAALSLWAVIAAAAVWLCSPRSLDIERPAWLLVRWGARLGLVCWAIGLWWAATSTSATWGPVWMQAGGLIGGVLLLAVLASTARELELLHTARKLTTSAVLLPPIMVFTWVMPFPEDAVTIAEGPVGFIHVVVLLVAVGPWFWLLARVARSLLDMSAACRWTAVARRDQARRDHAWKQRMTRDED